MIGKLLYREQLREPRGERFALFVRAVDAGNDGAAQYHLRAAVEQEGEVFDDKTVRRAGELFMQFRRRLAVVQKQVA